MSDEEGDSDLHSILAASLIREGKLRNLTAKGLPEGGVRGLVWRLLLRFLPMDKSHWPDLLNTKRTVSLLFFYSSFIRLPSDIMILYIYFIRL